MASTIKKALLIVNLHKRESRSVMDEIVKELSKQNIEVFICAFEGKPIEPPREAYDIAFSLGGDGTVLYSARCMAERGIPIFPINLGTLGFIASIQKEEWGILFAAYRAGEIPVSARLMLDVRVIREGKQIARNACLNDGVIAGTGISKIIRLSVGTKNVRFGAYRADGLILATPTGSTAYSVAAGGPILDPEMDAIILNPVCPFTLSNRSIVIPSDETVLVNIEKDQRSDVLLTIDGQIVVPLLPDDIVYIKRARRKAHIIYSDRQLFYNVLRTKLNWSGGPDA